MTRTSRALTLLAAVPLLTMAGATPASAHGQGTYLTDIASVRPHVPGLSVTVSTDGRWVHVTNTKPESVLVLGYEDEPYLRVTATGVWENARSPTTYLNRPQGSRGVRSYVDAGQAPRWRRLSAGPTVRFHDLRVPVTPKKPPAVHDEQRVITTWTMRIRSGHTAETVGGTLRWQPPPEGKGWIVMALLLGNGMLLLVGFAVWSDRRTHDGITEQRTATAVAAGP